MTAGLRALYLGTDLCSDATIAVSDTVRDRLVKWGVPARKITVIPNGAVSAASRSTRRNAPRCAGSTVSRPMRSSWACSDGWTRSSGSTWLSRQLRRRRCTGPIVGDGDECAHLEQVARTLGVQDDAIFAGERHDVGAMLRALDAFVASSSQETFGLSVLEALANGLLVVSTTCPALDDVPTYRAREVAGTVDAIRSPWWRWRTGAPGRVSPRRKYRSTTGSRPWWRALTTSTRAWCPVPPPRHQKKRRRCRGARAARRSEFSGCSCAEREWRLPAGQRGRSQ